MPSTNRVALVTGASTGIGREIARELARRGERLALVARDKAKLDALAAELGTPGGAAPLVVPIDLLAPGAGAALEAALAAAGVEVATLVNNAGFGLQGAVVDLAVAEQLAVVDLNCRSLTEITLRLLPQVRRAKGRILNVASSAAYLPGPGMTVYYASKAYALSFSEGLSHELKADGVTVTALCPGPVPTEFQRRAGMTKLLPAAMTLDAATVAKAGVDGLHAGKRVVVPGFAIKALVAISRLSPHAVALPAIASLQYSPSRERP
ncbi:MAG: SDR family oxidoreductase [Hyphomicrobiales bacterium]|nr:SDR family oxidoreductase [Hyphomicrobiales bacterium]MDE2016253.1 SDR family oxidoreductase [Hyphomicrobiales bacterium]